MAVLTRGALYIPLGKCFPPLLYTPHPGKCTMIRAEWAQFHPLATEPAKCMDPIKFLCTCFERRCWTTNNICSSLKRVTSWTVFSCKTVYNLWAHLIIWVICFIARCCRTWCWKRASSAAAPANRIWLLNLLKFLLKAMTVVLGKKMGSNKCWPGAHIDKLCD